MIIDAENCTDCRGKGTQVLEPTSSTCGFCDRTDATKRCVGCHTIYYCDRTCQRRHWTE